MKICLINNLYPPESLGGAERIVEIMAKAYVRKGEVIVITTHNSRKALREINGGVEIDRLPNRNFFHYSQAQKYSWLAKLFWHLLDLFNYRSAFEVANILKKENPDLVITNNLKGFSYQIPRAIKKLGLKHLHLLHDYQLIDPHGSLFRHNKVLENLTPGLFFYSRLCRFLFKKTDYLVSPSNFVLDKHLQYGFFKAAQKLVLPNPVESSSLLEQSAAVQPPANPVQGNIKLLYVGQLEEHKGIGFLLKILNDLNWPMEIQVIGSGSLYGELAEKYKTSEKISFLGKLDRKAIGSYFEQSEILVVPSLWWENSPTVIYESFAAGLPVMVSDSGGSAELVSQGQTGFIFKSGDERSLTETLSKVMGQRQKLKEMGLKAEVYVKNFSDSSYVDKITAYAGISGN